MPPVHKRLHIHLDTTLAGAHLRSQHLFVSLQYPYAEGFLPQLPGAAGELVDLAGVGLVAVWGHRQEEAIP